MVAQQCANRSGADRSTRRGSVLRTAPAAGSAVLAAGNGPVRHPAAHVALPCARLPVGDRWRRSPRLVPANTESSSRLPLQAPLLVLLMDAGPRGLGCQTAWVSFHATGGYVFR